MEIYLVGGAVRDRLLGLQPRERDWVVVGGTPEALTRKGFKPVGASFPVFLHPKTAEEYALARTERKQGHGYHGFSVEFDTGVTLEQDLQRRDLTINAMAMDEAGRIIDPYGGQRDLQLKLLRHVSPAFVEDPLRVLRVARFAARYAHLGFQVAAETLELMRAIAAGGELDHLVAERVWAELIKALNTARPSAFLQVLRQVDALPRLWPELDALYGVRQNPLYHPEVDAGVHLQLALDQAASAETDDQVRFAVLVHDLGKGITPKSQWPSHRGHEEKGVPLVQAFCRRLKAPGRYRELALVMCRQHLRVHRALSLRPATVLKLLRQANALRRPEQFERLLQACKADYLGRKGLSHRPYPQAHYLRACLQGVQQVNTKDLAEKNLPGEAVGELLRQRRLRAIKRVSVEQFQDSC